MNSRKTTKEPTQTKESETAKPSGLGALAQKPSLYESWLNGSLVEPGPHRGLGLQPVGVVRMSGDLIYDTIFYAVHEARRAVEGKTEEYVRTVWDILDTIFGLWFAENGIPEDIRERAAHLGKLRNDYFSGGHEDWKGIKFGEIKTHYDLYLHLEKEKYPPLLNSFSKVSPAHVLAALVLHDCANDLQSDIGGAYHELTFRNGYNTADIRGVLIDHAHDLISVFRPMQEKLNEQKKNLATGRQKGTESNKEKAADIKKLFIAVFKDHCRKHPFLTVDEHVAYVHNWAEKSKVTVSGARDTVIHDGNRYHVNINGKKPYSISHIRNIIKGVKATLNK